MRRSLVFGKSLFFKGQQKHHFLPLSFDTVMSQPHCSFAFDKSTYKINLFGLSYDDFVNEMNQERRFLDDLALSSIWVQDNEDLMPALKSACAKLDRVKRDYIPNSSDLELNLSGVGSALNIFEHILNLQTPASEATIKLAVDYLKKEFLGFFKKEINFSDQKKECYKNADQAIKKFLKIRLTLHNASESFSECKI